MPVLGKGVQKSEEKEVPFLFPYSVPSSLFPQGVFLLLLVLGVFFSPFFSVVSLSFVPWLCQKYWQLQYLRTERKYLLWLTLYSGPYLKAVITETGLVSSRARDLRGEQRLYIPQG